MSYPLSLGRVDFKGCTPFIAVSQIRELSGTDFCGTLKMVLGVQTKKNSGHLQKNMSEIYNKRSFILLKED